MEDGTDNKENSVLWSLALSLNILKINVTEKSLYEKLGKVTGLTSSDIIFLAKERFGLKAKRSKIKLKQLASYSSPTILELSNNEYAVFLGFKEGQYQVLFKDNKSPKKLSEADLKQQFTGFCILLKKPLAKQNIEQREFGFKWFISMFAQYKAVMSQVLIAALFVQLFALVTPLFTMVIIDKVLSSGGLSTLDVLIFGLVMISLFDFVIATIRKYMLHNITSKVDAVLGVRLYKHLTQLPISYYFSKQTGDTISRLKEVETIRHFISGQALTSLIDFPFLFVFLIIMAQFNTTMTLVVVVSIALSFLLYGIAAPIIKERLQKKHQIQTDNQSFLFESIYAIETIKSMSIETPMQRKWEDHVSEHSHLASSTEHLTSNISNISAFINKATIAVTLWIGANAVLDGNLTAGQLIAFNMMVGRVTGPAQRIAQMLQQLQQVKISVSRIGDILNTNTEPAYDQNRSISLDYKGKISFENVSFSYDSDLPPILKNINFEIKPGEIIGIYGSSGSGKSTLLKLIQRLLIPTDGTIKVDDKNIAQIDPAWHRKHIGAVLQDNILLNLSIKDNITLANPLASPELVDVAIKLSGADRFIKDLPKAFDTIVGERGALLSTGQRQRLAIARALVSNPQILVFDEATSALDSESEQVIHRNMKQIVKNRTAIIVAHRLSTLRICDRVFCIENGELVESGSIDTLMTKKDSRFMQLCKIQQLDVINEA